MTFLRSTQIIPTLILVSSCLCSAQDGRIQQARETGRLSADPASAQGQRAFLKSSTTGDDESFGVQQLLSEGSGGHAFSAFAEVSAFYTDNVRLTRDNEQGQAFLVPAFGFAYRGKLPAGLQFDLNAGLSTFRYESISRLDFTSIDVLATVSYKLDVAGGVDVSVGYRFNDLVDTTGESFFRNHGIDFGLQKSIALGGPHSAFVAVGAELAFSEPSISERNEYFGVVGYSLQAAEKWDIFLRYRYSYFDYTEGGRGDHNHTVSIGTRYRFTDSFSVFATSYWVANRSGEGAFDYEAGTAGLGLTLKYGF